MRAKEREEEHKSSSAKSWKSEGCQPRFYFLLTALVVLTTLFAPETASGAESLESAITVLVFNFRQVPVKTLVMAENEAGAIIDRAGMRVTWQDCPTGDRPCQKGPGRTFVLAMMASPSQNQFLDTVSGYAIISDELAVVYYDYLPRIPPGNTDRAETARILGCVIAHELGHLLLGTSRHSVAGIMRANWDFEQTRRALMSQLFFLTEEAEVMQGFSRQQNEHREAAVSALVSH